MNLEILDICNRRLESDIKIIRNSVLQRLSQIDAIILCGGYGRGEGSWIIDKSTKKVYPYNDYDLYIVTDMKPSSRKISEIENEISKKVGLKWIDIDTITKKKLTNLKPSIKNIDLKYASKIIYGDKNILKEIPDINPSNISTLDIEILYFTRLWTFMGSLSETGFTDLNIEEARFFKNQMAKALLACVDVLLLQNNQYDTSYIKRLKIAIGLYPEKEWLTNLG
ncbi:hypothetical protein, partial [Empedobacter sp.]|uniref:hypothetical protein n=1 Tax=Empedobacter sp. TaxID=1927715 RepID=UPI0028A8D7B8